MKYSTFLSTLFFTLVALLSFAIWALGSAWYTSETGMYTLCAIVFFGLGGLALSPSAGVTGGKNLVGFSLRFACGFLIYAFLWTVAWFTFRNTFGEVTGSFFGLAGLVWVLRRGLHPKWDLPTATAVVFLWHTLGYYLGGQAYDALQNRGVLAIELPWGRGAVVTLARFSWGLFYGLGLGYGLARMLQASRPS
jgi:hypothetical protein